jgi:methionyl-tRNA synthetase
LDLADNRIIERVLIACGEDIPGSFESFAFSAGIESWIDAVFACNKYVDEQAPWTLRKTDFERMKAVLLTLYECVAYLASVIQPIVPESAARLLDAMGLLPAERCYEGLHGGRWLARLRASDFRLAPPSGVFPRLELPA